MAERISLVIAGRGLFFGEGSDVTSSIRSLIPADYGHDVDIILWSTQPGSHYSVRMTMDLFQLLTQQVTSGAKAVVVFCGSGAVEEMAYLAGLLWRYPQPLIFAAMADPLYGEHGTATLISDILAAAASHAVWNNGVLVCADGRLYSSSDVLQEASFGRMRFGGRQSGNIGIVSGGIVSIWHKPILTQQFFGGVISPSTNVELIYATVGGGRVFIQALAEADPKKVSVEGLVIAGFGSGSVYPSWIPYLRTLAFKDIPIVMVSRCVRGRVLDRGDYEGSFLRLKELGIMDGGFLSPLQARLKLAVGIGAGIRGRELQKYLLEG